MIYIRFRLFTADPCPAVWSLWTQTYTVSLIFLKSMVLYEIPEPIYLNWIGRHIRSLINRISECRPNTNLSVSITFQPSFLPAGIFLLNLVLDCFLPITVVSLSFGCFFVGL